MLERHLRRGVEIELDLAARLTRFVFEGDGERAFIAFHADDARVARKIDAIIATVEGDAQQIKVALAARYGNVTLGITGSDPESARYTINLGDQPLSFYRDLEGEALARKTLTELGLKYSPDAEGFIATGDAAVEFMIVGLPLLPETWERRVPQLLTNCPQSDADVDRLVLSADEVPFVDPTTLTVTVVGAP